MKERAKLGLSEDVFKDWRRCTSRCPRGTKVWRGTRADVLSTSIKVAGLRIAFAHTNSTISFLIRSHLARAGLNVGNFAMISNLASTAWAKGSPESESQSRGDPENDDHAHHEVTRQVLANAFDVGESQHRHFSLNQHRGKGLVELHRFPVVPDVIVAKTGSNYPRIFTIELP